MALIDLSLVSSALIKLLDENINNVIDASAGVTVTAQPPEKVGAASKTLSLHLYHLAEEPGYKNLEGPQRGGRNIASTPMALSLYYILTAHHESSEPEFDPLTQQRIMGYALKTFHDYPLLFDSTKIGTESIFPIGMIGKNNPVQIVLRPTAPEDALAFWGSEESQTARLSAYYEVRVVLLEPDEPTQMAAPVLSLGTYLYQLGAPHLESTHSKWPFTLPAVAGGEVQVVEASPARVSADIGATPLHNRVILRGTNLRAGESRQLWLRTERWSKIPQPNGTGGPIPIDLSISANPSAGWALSNLDDQLVLDVAEDLKFLNQSDEEKTMGVFPGIYTAFLRVTHGQRVAGGEVIPITSDSNEVPLVIAPRIDGVGVPDLVNNRLEINIVTTFPLKFGEGTDDELDIRLIIDGQVYIRKPFLVAPPDPNDNDGRFHVVDDEKLIFQAFFDLSVAGDHPVRLIVNGAESAPFWIELS